MWLGSLSSRQRTTLLGLAHNVVVSDGILDPNEELMIDEFKREMDLGSGLEPEYHELDGIDAIFNSRSSRLVAMLNLLRLSYSDGAFEIEEECLLKEIAAAFQIGDDDFLLLDNWVRRFLALEDEARSLIRS